MTALVVEPALLDAARFGDPRAIETLLFVCQPNIRRYAQRSCSITVVDDAVQETLLILARRITQLQHVAALSSWLFAVARRECRRFGRQMIGIDPWEEWRVDAWSLGKRDETLRLEVAQAIESLSAELREVVMLRDFEGLTISEIAARLGISRPAIKSRIHRARMLMREYLAP